MISKIIFMITGSEAFASEKVLARTAGEDVISGGIHFISSRYQMDSS
jgi:hypothetical protein